MGELIDKLNAAPSNVLAAMATLRLDSSTSTERCSVMTHKGTRCTKWRLNYAPSCRGHLTPEQKADLSSRVAEARAIVTAHFGPTVRAEPACWSWPVTPEAIASIARCRSAGDVLNESRSIYYAMFDWQRGRCAVCGGGRRPDADGDFPDDNMVLDHDHSTGHVRGWLCRGCNVREGKGGGTLFDLYRNRPPATMLGVEVWYFDEQHGVWAEPPEALSGEHPGYRISGLLTPEVDQDSA